MRDFYSEHSVKGRSGYMCTFCGRGISKGEQHVHVTMSSSNNYHQHRAHTECHELATNQPAPVRRCAA